MIDFTDMLNRKLSSVALIDGGGVAAFRFQDGGERRFAVDGDCCSSSWIEHLEMPHDISGAVILSVDDSAPITQDHNDHDGEDPECISVYNTSFRTDRGEIILEYRNSSNGFYGVFLGFLVDEAVK